MPSAPATTARRSRWAWSASLPRAAHTDSLASAISTPARTSTGGRWPRLPSTTSVRHTSSSPSTLPRPAITQSRRSPKCSPTPGCAPAPPQSAPADRCRAAWCIACCARTTTPAWSPETVLSAPASTRRSSTGRPSSRCSKSSMPTALAATAHKNIITTSRARSSVPAASALATVGIAANAGVSMSTSPACRGCSVVSAVLRLTSRSNAPNGPSSAGMRASTSRRSSSKTYASSCAPTSRSSPRSRAASQSATNADCAS
jgi:hypothetical protein